MYVAWNISTTIAQLTAGEEKSKNDSTNAEDTPTPEPTVTPTETPAPTPTEAPVVFTPSKEAEQGTWISSGSNWLFMVDGAAYTGWLVDTDGSQYYLDSDGIMQTGWLTDNGRRYYLNQDGIMQTGVQVIDGETYQFRSDGTLVEEGEDVSVTATAVPTEVPAEASEATPTEAPAEEADASATPTESPDKDADASVADPTETPDENTDASTEAPDEDADASAATPAPMPAEDESAEASAAAVTEVPKDTTSEDDKDKADASATPTATVAATAAPTATATPAATPVPDKSVALTFDDGPSDYTTQILDVLEETDTKATFFMSGNSMEKHADIITRMQSLGHELGNHAYTHFDLSQLNLTDSSAEVAGVDELLNSYLGVTTTVMRPPYGNMNESLTGVIRKPVILWSIDSQDDTLTDAQQIVDTILESIEDGDIILMHDTYEVTAQAVKLLIPALAEQGYECMTVTDLAAAHGIELLSGSTYTSMKADTQ
jgi:peptidoglycan/xylan/chitin deacetylase (PgdA/CDA1 family)